MPRYMNCPHSDDWCLSCVDRVHKELEDSESKVADLERQLAEVTAQVASLTEDRDRQKGLIRELAMERDEARKEVERLRAALGEALLAVHDHVPQAFPGAPQRQLWVEKMDRWDALLAAAPAASEPTAAGEQVRRLCHFRPGAWLSSPAYSLAVDTLIAAGERSSRQSSREEVPAEVHERGWQWRPVSSDTAFAPPFATIRVCRGCGCLVAGGPTVCMRCAAIDPPKPSEEGP